MGSTDNSGKYCPKDEAGDSDEDRICDSADEQHISSDKGNSGTSQGTTIGSSGSRPRHDSNSSCDSNRSHSTDRMKRRRTTSLSSSPLSSFFFPPAQRSSSTSPLLSSSPSRSSLLTYAPSSGSDPSLMPLDDVMNAVNGVTNMALAHEIALDSNFKLEKFEPPASSLEKQVRDVMHQAFWDNLREQLRQSSPVYTQAFVLLQEVREQLLEITLPHQERLRQEIKDKLDFDLIKQQAEHGVLDFAEYSCYVVSLMAKLCAPVRDEVVQQLGQQKDVVDVFCGVAETLDLMKLDMANYQIQMIRPTIVKQIVEYERAKFKEFQKTQKDGLELTRALLLKHVNLELSKIQSSTDKSQQSAADSPTPSPNVAASSTNTDVPSTSTAGANSLNTPASLLADPLAHRAFCSKALNSAYLELLEWPQDALLPETVCVDSERVLELRDRLYQLCILSSVMLVSLSTLTQHQPQSADRQDKMKQRLKRDLCPILDPVYTRSETLAALPNLVEQVIVSLQSHLSENDLPALTPATVTALRSSLGEVRTPGHRVVGLIFSRCLGFLAQLLANTSPRNLTLPQPMQLLQEEMARICGAFLRVTQHNRAVFGEYYYEIVHTALKDRTSEASSKSTDSASSEATASRDDKQDKKLEEKEESSERWDSLSLD